MEKGKISFENESETFIESAKDDENLKRNLETIRTKYCGDWYAWFEDVKRMPIADIQSSSVRISSLTAKLEKATAALRIYANVDNWGRELGSDEASFWEDDRVRKFYYDGDGFKLAADVLKEIE
jgi:hypothetical protein